MKTLQRSKATGSTMTPFLIIIGLVVVLGTVGFLLVQNRQQAGILAKERELAASTRETKSKYLDELEDLRAKLADVKQAKANEAELARLQEELLKMKELETKNLELQALNLQLGNQLTELVNLQKQTGSAVATTATSSPSGSGSMPAPPPAKNLNNKEICIQNLKQIDQAKKYWAEVEDRASSTVPNDFNLFGPVQFIKAKPVCPDGGTYSLGAINEKCSCTVAGHSY